MTREPPVRWASRLSQRQIKQLYEADARGLCDEELIDDVGYSLYSRCQSILHVADAMVGRVHCPRCDTVVHRQTNDVDEELRCPACAWRTTWDAYHATYRTQELGAGGARDIFKHFVATWPGVRGSRDKMVLIDQLIHRWHWETHYQTPSFGLGRPTGVNLIEGNRKQVLAFLDELTYGAASTAGLEQTKATWRERRDEVRRRQALGRKSDVVD